MKMKNFVRVAIWTAGLLLIPLALQLTIGTGVDGQGFNWKPGDFAVIGVLLFVTGSLIDLAYRKAGKNKALAIAGIIILFLGVWAELAVGVFTNWGS